jgi:hypothetical protein
MEAGLRERAAEGKTSLGPEELAIAARSIGYAAVKYADLKNHPTTNYNFSYDRMLDTKVVPAAIRCVHVCFLSLSIFMYIRPWWPCFIMMRLILMR